MLIYDVWADSDKKESGTPYWDYITSPENAFHSKLIDLLKKYPIEVTGNEFILQPKPAILLLIELETLGIAVRYVSVWCFTPNGLSPDDCCPGGMGGPGAAGGRFREYVHIGFSVPNAFDRSQYEIELANKWNPLVRNYIEFQLPKEPDFNEYIRVSPSLYVPLMWNLFPV